MNIYYNNRCQVLHEYGNGSQLQNSGFKLPLFQLTKFLS